jgi:hypothetical protein
MDISLSLNRKITNLILASLDWITLIARDCKRYEWMPGLTIGDRFNESFLGLSEESERFLYRRFNRGKYLVKVEGTDDALRCAKDILNRRRNSEIWYLEHSAITRHRNPL